MAESIPEDLFVGEPVLTARWRLHRRALPLMNRHLRAFGLSGVSGGLASWARQHIEWTLAEGSGEHPDGVLVLKVDAEGRAAMSVEEYAPLGALGADELAARARAADGQPVAGEVAWAARADGLVAFTDGTRPLSGANSLVADLARTLGTPLEFAGRPPEPGERLGDEAFLVSDEHGVVPSSDLAGPAGERYRAYYEKLLAQARPDQYDRANLGISG